MIRIEETGMPYEVFGTAEKNHSFWSIELSKLRDGDSRIPFGGIGIFRRSRAFNKRNTFQENQKKKNPNLTVTLSLLH